MGMGLNPFHQLLTFQLFSSFVVNGKGGVGITKGQRGYEGAKGIHGHGRL